MVAPNPLDPECDNSARYLPLGMPNSFCSSSISMIPHSTKWLPPPDVPSCEYALSCRFFRKGRQMSRTMANKTFTKPELKDLLRKHNVTLIGGGLDEAPGAYKDINTVMAAQTDLVDVIARFKPRMVRMADDGSRED